MNLTVKKKVWIHCGYVVEKHLMFIDGVRIVLVLDATVKNHLIDTHHEIHWTRKYP